MSENVNILVLNDKVSQFLQHTLGNLAEGYVVSLAELSSIKDSIYQKERLALKQDLKAKDNELAVLRKKLEQAEAELASTKLCDLQKLLSDKESALKEANAKIGDMEDAVNKLLSKVMIPGAMIKYMVIRTQQRECLEEWGCREGGLIKPNTYDVLKTDLDWLGWSVNGFIMSKLKNAGDFVDNEDRVAKYVDLDA